MRRKSHRRDACWVLARRVQVAESGAEGLKACLGNDLRARDRRTKNEADGRHRLRARTSLGGELSSLVKAALGAGANHFLVKAISPAKLYERIGWAIGDARPFVVRDGHYVIGPAKKAEPVKVAAAQ
jgi:hypothetical protein